ncbi:hypothetical protein ACU61A_15270 [Pseudonocardia sichuanensis]
MRRGQERSRTRAGAAGVLALAFALAGCGAGQQAQTSVEVTMTGGVGGQVGSMILRDAQFTYDPPVPGDTVYEPGATAPLQVTIVNDATTALDDGMRADRLVSVSSPIAESGRIVGDTRIPDGHVLTAGYDEPVSSIAVDETTVADIALVGLTEPIRAGLTYPVVFTFEHAGELRLEVPVENPDILPPRARDAGSGAPGIPQRYPVDPG